MSFAFPPNPSPGDTYTGPNSVEYTWDGTKWIGTVAGGGGGDELLEVETTVTDADVLLAVNTRNVLTISGLTALRTALFPAGAKGDVIEVELVTKAPTDYELVIAGDTGVSMRLRDQTPVTAAEVTRLFLLGEAMQWVHDGTDWVCTALDDGRIPSYCGVWLSTSATGESANTFAAPTSKGGAWTLFEDNAELARLATSEIRIRRANIYGVQVKGGLGTVASNTFLSIVIRSGGQTIVSASNADAVGRAYAYGGRKPRFNAGELIQYAYTTSSGNKGLYGVNARQTHWSVLEQF
jgi:hypothetical protein